MILKFFLLKEGKKYPFFFLLLFITLFLGTFGLVGIKTVSDQVEHKLRMSAKEILTSDLAISARRDLTDSELKTANEVLPHQTKSYRIFDIYSMATQVKSSQGRLVEIRGTEEGFPFYGKVVLREGAFHESGLFISKELADLWNIQLGEELQLGELKLPVEGIVQTDSSQGLRGFSLAPRVYLPLKKLQQSGLLKPGVTGGFAYHYKFAGVNEEDLKNIKKSLLSVLTDPGIKVTLAEESSEQTGRVLNYLTDFMGLAALIGLLLSLIGVFYLYQSHLLARLRDLCLLNLHGLKKSQIILGIVTQFSMVFFLTAALQVVLLVPAYKFTATSLSQMIGLELSNEVRFSSLLSETPFLYIFCLAVLVPLLLGLMRTTMGLQLKAPKMAMGRFRFYDFGPFIILLWAHACRLSHSYRVGSLFLGALFLIFLLSTLLIKFLQSALRRTTREHGLRFPSLELGMALKNFTRSGNKLTLSFLSLALGTTLITLILQLDCMIQGELTLDASRPALFLFDIQEEQKDPLVEFTQKRGVPLQGITPMVRARLEEVNGRAFTREDNTDMMKTREEEVSARFKNRGINLTYRQGLGPGEKIVEGHEFPAPDPTRDVALVSLEKKFAQRMGLKMGDKLTFDVQGVPVQGVVHNLREVKWTSFYPNFFVNVGPGHIDEAPKTFLAVAPHMEKEKKLAFQRAVVEEFPNVSLIDIEELVGKLSELFEKSRRAIEVISWLSLGVGFVILYGLSHDQVYRRTYDLALLKGLGLSAMSIRKILLYEFGLLFFLALGTGFFLGWLMAVLIGREVFRLGWSVDWPSLFLAGTFLSILCLATILLASLKATQARVRELLSDA